MLAITDSVCRLGKFSNNLDKHGEDDYTAFDVPLTVELPRPALNALVSDRLFDRRVFDEPAPGKAMSVGEGFLKFAPMKFRDSFEDAHVVLVLAGQTFAYDKCKISKIVLDFCLGGTTKCAMSIHVKPNTDREILLLLHHQRREVRITISGGKLVEADSQGDLPLSPQEDVLEFGKPATDELTFGGDNVQPIR